ncbi:MAG TPA: efflux RND transporter periplasmic adaptor subunit [Bryobacteraceae bacterium]|jgi:multidrug efflux system membrane fusion protein|nr:efflux RND transporter periplasmic adaptor subunit [Bryobacteraceae bacterium]
MSTDSSSSEIPAKKPSAAPPARAGRSRTWAIWLAVLCLIGAGGYMLSQGQSTKTATSKKGKGKGGKNAGAIPVAVTQVVKGDLGVYIEALGIVTPVYTVTVTSRVTGQLMSVNYREGQIVHKGDLLAVIDPRPYEAALTQAEGQLERDQALLSNAHIDLQRYKSALDQHAIPEQTYATQTATVSQDEGTVKVDQGTLQAAQVNVDYTKITSPIDGRVGLRTVDPGNIVPANGTTGLLTITQLQPITVIFTMAEDYISDVAPQLRAGRSLRVDALDRAQETELAQGSVLTVDNQIDTTTGTVKVRATFANRDYKLFPNEFVNAKMLVRTLRNVNLIPMAAIQRDNDVAYVYILQPNRTVKSQNIKIQNTDGTTAAVTGVNVGQTLVTDGFDRLTDGAKVVVRQPAETPADANPNSAQETALPEPNEHVGPANAAEGPLPGDANPGYSKHGDINPNSTASAKAKHGKKNTQTQGTEQ